MENILLLVILAIVALIIYTKFNILSLKESFYNADDIFNTRKSEIRNLKTTLNTKSKQMNDEISKLEKKYNTVVYKDKTFDDLLTRDNENEILDKLKNKMNTINELTSEQVEINDNYNKKKITNMENDLKDLETLLKIEKTIKTPYNGFYSILNGLKLGVSPTKNNKYKVNINGGCLEDRGNMNYGVKICSDNKTQDFNIFKISSSGFYNSILEPSLDKVRDSDNIEYPFYVIKSSNTDKCLQNNFGKLSIQPCVVKKSQRWNKLNKVKCQ